MIAKGRFLLKRKEGASADAGEGSALKIIGQTPEARVPLLIKRLSAAEQEREIGLFRYLPGLLNACFGLAPAVINVVAAFQGLKDSVEYIFKNSKARNLCLLR